MDLKFVIAGNIMRLRTDAGMTQSELGALLNYSDKSISKWERAESLPDANVLKQLSEIFGVSVDYIFNTHDADEERSETVVNKEEKKSSQESSTDEIQFNLRAVEAIAICGIATFALFLFIVFWISLNVFAWVVFFAALPASALAHLVMNTLWNKGRRNILIIGVFIFSLLLLVYYVFIYINPWQIFLLLVPIAVILFCVTKIRKKHP